MQGSDRDADVENRLGGGGGAETVDELGGYIHGTMCEIDGQQEAAAQRRELSPALCADLGG